MENIRELLIIGCEVLCIAGLLAILAVITARNRKKRELREHATEKTRDDRLRFALENRHAPMQIKDEAAKNVAYQVSYLDYSEKRGDAVCVQLTEQGPLAAKEYIFYIEDVIRIGSDPQNELVIRDEQAPLCDAQLVRDAENIFVKGSVQGSRVYLQREKKQYLVDDRLVRVREGDRLIIGKTSVQIRFVNI